jgi:hypothetical protein
VIQILQDLQGLLNDGMAFFALDVSHEAHPASVVLVGRRIQAVLLQIGNFGGRRHGALLLMSGKTPRILQRNNNANQINWGQIPINFPLNFRLIN